MTFPRNPDGLLVVSGPHRVRVGSIDVNGAVDTLNPGAYCLDDGRHHRGAPHRLGRLPLFGLSAPASGTMAVVVEERGSLLDALVDLGPCPPDLAPPALQIRSDWLPPEGGSRTTRARLAELPAVYAVAAEPIAVGTVVREGDTFVVTLHNPFDVALSGLDWQVHREGGRGKPMPRYETVRVELPPGGAHVLRIPADDPVDGVRWKAYAVEARGTVGNASFDLFVLL